MMPNLKKHSVRRILIGGVSALVLTAIAVPQIGFFSTYSDVAHAQESDGHGGDGQGSGGQGAGGNGGQGQGAGGSGGHDGSTGGSAGQGQGGPGEDSDGKGPQAGAAGGNKGTKPAWAQEGIPEVELGRLNVSRSPDKVLDRALVEVIANFNPDTMASLYELSAAAFAQEVLANWDTITIVDSPLENLALLEQLWETGSTALPTVDPASVNDLSGILIGVASDKAVPVSEDTVTALAGIFGVDLSAAAISSIAAKAEVVRQAISEAHG